MIFGVWADTAASIITNISVHAQQHWHDDNILMLAEPAIKFVEAVRKDPYWQPQLAQLSPQQWYSHSEVPQVLQQILAGLNTGHDADAQFVQRAKDCFPAQWV